MLTHAITCWLGDGGEVAEKLHLVNFDPCTLGEMTRLESHQVENEIFEFLKNFFSMA